MFSHLFGPVPSRRLGISLGVDLVPHKTCSLDCIYCECGATDNLTVERREYVPVDEVFEELDRYFQFHPDPEFITFSGSGEPTFNSRIGDCNRSLPSPSRNFPGKPLSPSPSLFRERAADYPCNG